MHNVNIKSWIWGYMEGNVHLPKSIVTLMQVVSEMTYTVSSGMLNPSLPYLTLMQCHWTEKNKLEGQSVQCNEHITATR